MTSRLANRPYLTQSGDSKNSSKTYKEAVANVATCFVKTQKYKELNATTMSSFSASSAPSLQIRKNAIL